MTDDLTQNEQLLRLLRLAEEAATKAYAPYSRFRVGSALELSNGEIVLGTNVENVSFGLTICAERAALVSAVSRFGPEIKIVAAAITNLNHSPSPPCGACRQVLAEFMLPAAPVIFPAADGLRTFAFQELLPCSGDMQLK